MAEPENPELWLICSPGLRDSLIDTQNSARAANHGQVNLPFEVAGNPRLPAGAANTADNVTASPRYSSVMGIRLLRGRLFPSSDSSSSPLVALINTAPARRYFANQDRLGRHLVFAFPLNGPASREIVGVVGDAHDLSPGGKTRAPDVRLPSFHHPTDQCSCRDAYRKRRRYR